MSGIHGECRAKPDAEMEKIKTYLVNPVESRVASMEKPESLDMKADVPANVARVTGFTQWDDEKCGPTSVPWALP